MLMCNALKSAEDAGLTAVPTSISRPSSTLWPPTTARRYHRLLHLRSVQQSIKSAAMIQLQGGEEKFTELY
jgi:branched-chain amino acid transport system substrate-binding protein